MLLAELYKGYKEYLSQAIAHNSEFDTLSLGEQTRQTPQIAPENASKAPADMDALPYTDVLERYTAEIDRTNALAEKTKSEKLDALSLVADLTSAKPPAEMTKADAREVKAALPAGPAGVSVRPRTPADVRRNSRNRPSLPLWPVPRLWLYLPTMSIFT